MKKKFKLDYKKKTRKEEAEKISEPVKLASASITCSPRRRHIIEEDDFEGYF